MNFKHKTAELLTLADVKINGRRPWDIQVHNEDFYQQVFAQGSLGLGESYMDGWWDCKALDQFFAKVLSAKLGEKIKPASLILYALKARLLNLQTKGKSKIVAQQHYDLGNELYSYMLDKNMQYTCSYWKNAKNLDEAQEAKLKLICEKLRLKPGMSILELGGGFGGLARYIAKKYKCKVVSYNISKEQIHYARKICKGLPVTIVESDYRNARGMFDHVVSIGLAEHVGYKNHQTLMHVAHRCLKKDGLFLLHTIGRNTSATYADPWINKYIFPGGVLPSIKQLARASEGLFVMEDWHNFGADYDKTLMAWFHNFDKSWVKLKPTYGERFYRMWKYYLLSCAGAFRVRNIQLWQIVFSKDGVQGGYQRVS
jgi:cyclopropane-fatty-acyl-phospholipid synthase